MIFTATIGLVTSSSGDTALSMSVAPSHKGFDDSDAAALREFVVVVVDGFWLLGTNGAALVDRRWAGTGNDLPWRIVL